MNLSHLLKFIKTVEANSRVNILLELNDGHTLLVEGSFTLSRCSEELVNSIDYVDSNFDVLILGKIQSLLDSSRITDASFSEDNASLTIVTESGVVFKSYFRGDDYESWELRENSRTIFGAECGVIVRY